MPNFHDFFSEIISYFEIQLDPLKRAVDKAQVCPTLKAIRPHTE